MTAYAPVVGGKFYEDGRVKQFPGNTVICFCDPQGQAYQDAEWAQTQLVTLPFADKFSMLPPPSFHMTVFELLCDDVRRPENWSSNLSLDASLAETDDYFIEKVPQVPAPENFRMVFDHLSLGTVGLSLRLQPADEDNAKALKAYRDALAEATGIRFPNHETYAYHISLAYRILLTTEEEEKQLQGMAETINQRLKGTFGVFDTGKPTLTFFDDMFAFLPVDQRDQLSSRS